MTDMQSILR